MLPRGFVPPSSSSACHNAAPDSLRLFCGVAAASSSLRPP
ncbi:unnamed protein product [Spirodela intermedia]|nr:unnamed protein product [Spirodela intermedia]CAA6665257.1 unnamed protein product [Spirodela intermedia]